MRKFILVAASVLVSATAQAETKRGLTVTSATFQRKRSSVAITAAIAAHFPAHRRG
jgi:uncharacterized protein (DUF2141 family)